MVYGAYPEVFLRVGENFAYVESGCLERKSVFILMYHTTLLMVVEKHPLSGGIQQKAVAAVRVYVVDVGVCQQPVFADGFRSFDEPARVRIKQGQLMVPCQPQFSIVSHEEISGGIV